MKRMQGQGVIVHGKPGELRGRAAGTRDGWWVRFDGAVATDTFVYGADIRYGAVPTEASPHSAGALARGR